MVVIADPLSLSPSPSHPSTPYASVTLHDVHTRNTLANSERFVIDAKIDAIVKMGADVLVSCADVDGESARKLTANGVVVIRGAREIDAKRLAGGLGIFMYILQI